MQEHEIELSIGDTIRIGEYIVTVVDIDRMEVSLRVESLITDEIQVTTAEPAVRANY